MGARVNCVEGTPVLEMLEVFALGVFAPGLETGLETGVTGVWVTGVAGVGVTWLVVGLGVVELAELEVGWVVGVLAGLDFPGLEGMRTLVFLGARVALMPMACRVRNLAASSMVVYPS